MGDGLLQQRWIASGLADITAPRDGPGGSPPDELIPRVDHLVERLSAASARVGLRLEVDGLGLLAARARADVHRRSRRESIRGHSRLIACRDGWMALTLSRPDDVEVVPAFVEMTLDISSSDPHDGVWDAITERCSSSGVASMVERGVLLGLPIAALAESQDATRDADGVRAVCLDPGATSVGAGASLCGVRVVDLSSLWAGPLCGALLAEAGADVVKVESQQRPDGARRGSPELFEQLNGRKRHRIVDLAAPTGVEELRGLLADAHVVIEASRPRALAQWGVPVPMQPTHDDGQVWISITAHGYDGDAAHRIGFGDDTAVAGGLVTWADEGPGFCGDAIADPLTGLTAATVTLEKLAVGGRHHLDIAMSAVAHRATVPV